MNQSEEVSGQALPEGVSFHPPAASECAALLEHTDWSRTPIGPLEEWPRTLRGYAGMIMQWASPAIIFWGDNHVQIYNDGYAQIMGPRHPEYFGATFAECWPETYPTISPWMQRVLRDRQVVKVERTLIPLTRRGFVEEAHFTFSFSPLLDDAGTVGGVLQPVVEVTHQVLADRRLETLRGLRVLPDAVSMLQVLADNAADCPFAAVFLHCGGVLHACGSFGLTADIKPLLQVLNDRPDESQSYEISDIQNILPHPPAGPWPEETRLACVIPIRRSVEQPSRGVIVLGVSPRLSFDDAYRAFFSGVGTEIAVVLAAADERVARHRALEQQEHLYRFFLQTPVAICVLEGPDHVFGFCNEAYLAFLGRGAELLGKPIREALPELEGQGIFELLDGVYQSGEPFAGRQPVQFAVQAGGNREIFADFVYSPNRDADGRVVGIVVVASDVTLQAVAARRVEQSEIRSQLALRATRDAVWDWDLVTERVLWNEAIETEYGYSADARRVDATWWYEHIHPDERDHVVAGIHEAHDRPAQQNWSDEYSFQRADGSYASVFDRGYIVRDAQGQAIRMIGAMQDVSYRKRSERELLERTQHAQFAADVGNAFTTQQGLGEKLHACTEAMVEHLHAAFARVWLYKESEGVLELSASSGLYTRVHDSEFARIPFGQFKVGRIAASREPHLTNSVQSDPQIRYPEWARREGVVAFAGYPLVAHNRVLGVVALFAKAPLSEATIKALASIADVMALGIDQALQAELVRSSEQRFRSLVEAAAAVVWTSPSDGSTASMLPSWTAYTGASQATYTGGGWWELFEPGDREMLAQRWEAAVETGTDWEATARLWHAATASYRWGEIRVVPILNQDRTVREWIATVIDVDERRRAQAAMENQQNWLESILSLAPIPLLLLEPDTNRVLLANREADVLAGGRFRRDLDGRDYIHYCTDDAGRRIPHEQMPAMRAGRGEKLEGLPLNWHVHDKTYALLVYSDTLPACFGHPATVVVAFSDVSALKQTETALQEALRARDEFLTVASHELKTPLTPLKLQLQRFTRLARKGGGSKEQLTQLAELSEKQIGRLSHLVDDLLDVSRITTGRFTLNQEAVELESILQELLERYLQQAQSSGCALELQSEGDVWVRVDRLRLEQVLDNLLVNAFKYAPGSRIHISLCRIDGAARIEVRDRGPGIEPDNLSRIFQRFERATSSSAVRGLGLGLYISRQILEAHGGRIWAESQVGHGSTFVMELPGTAESGNVDGQR